jgi:hypothetical protein
MVMSQEMKNLRTVTLGMTSSENNNVPTAQAQINRANSCLPLFGMLADGLRTAQAGWQALLPQGQQLPSTIPNDYSFQGGLTLFDTLPQTTRTSLTDLGLDVGAFLTDVRNAAEEGIPVQLAGNILRGNSLFEVPFRKTFSDAIAPNLARMHEQLTQHLTNDMKQTAKLELVRLGVEPNVQSVLAHNTFGNPRVRNVVLDSPSGRQFLQRMANMITQNPLRSHMEAAIRLLRNEVKPHVPSAEHATKLLSALAGITFLPAMPPIYGSINPATEPDRYGTMQLMQQAINMRLRPAGTNPDGSPRPADILYTALSQLQGFNELVAPPQDHIDI